MTTQKLTHLALIMDGNRRWAKQHKLKALQGHQQASDHTIEPLIEHASSLGIPYVTFWAFSTENWHRSQAEVEGMMQIFRQGLAKNLQKWVAAGWCLKAIGDPSKFPEDIRQGLAYWIKASEKNTKITVTFALNYGGRDEIVRAVKSIPSAKLKKLNQAAFSTYLDTHNTPDPDLIIRTGGEKRLSGYLPYQSAYSELYFTDTLWPDFTPTELDKAIEEYQTRKRNFGH